MYAKVPLQGAELEEFLQKERQEKEKEAAHKAVQERKERMLEADEDDDDDSDIDDDSDEENEVELQLAGDMDVDEDEKPDGRLTRKKKSGAGGPGGLGASDEWDAAGEDGGLSKHLSFDIYLKGNVSKSTSFFKSADGQMTQRFRMFPHIEKKRRVDEYGETIDVALWLRRDKLFQHEGRDEEKEKKRILDEDTRVRFVYGSPPCFSLSDLASFLERPKRTSFQVRHLQCGGATGVQALVR